MILENVLTTVLYHGSSYEATWKLQSTELMENMLELMKTMLGWLFLEGNTLIEKVRGSVKPGLSKVKLFDNICLVQ